MTEVAPLPRETTLELFFDDCHFGGQPQRGVGMADSEMANFGECLAIAGRRAR